MNEEITDDAQSVPAPEPPIVPAPVVPFMGDQDLEIEEDFPKGYDPKSDGGRLIINKALKEMPYRDYLQTEHWQTVRFRALADARYRCFQCFKRIPLDVHHVDESYRSRGEETPADVVALCKGPDGCHKLQHEVLQHVIRAKLAQQFNREP